VRRSVQRLSVSSETHREDVAYVVSVKFLYCFKGIRRSHGECRPPRPHIKNTDLACRSSASVGRAGSK